MENMKLKFDFNNMMTKYVGERGISEEEISALSEKIEKAEKAMEEKRKSG